MVEVDIPRLFKAGCPSDQTLEREGGAVVKEPRSAPYFLELTNRPVCANKERDRFSMAQPPRLEKAGNVHLNHLLCKATRGMSGIRQETLPVSLDASPVTEAYKKDVDRTLLRENLKLTTGERIAELEVLWKERLSSNE